MVLITHLSSCGSSTTTNNFKPIHYDCGASGKTPGNYSRVFSRDGKRLNQNEFSIIVRKNDGTFVEDASLITQKGCLRGLSLKESSALLIRTKDGKESTIVQLKNQDLAKNLFLQDTPPKTPSKETQTVNLALVL